MKKGIVSVISMISVMIFILVAFYSPWYSIGMKSSIGGESNVYQDYYLTKIEMHGTIADNVIHESMDYDDMRRAYEDIQGMQVPEEFEEQYEVFEQGFAIWDNTRYLIIGLLITSILALIGILGFIFRKANELRKIGIIFGIVTFILATIVVCYFAISFTNLSSEQSFLDFVHQFPDFGQGEIQISGGDFWGSISFYGNTMSWGPGFA